MLCAIFSRGFDPARSKPSQGQSNSRNNAAGRNNPRMRYPPKEVCAQLWSK